MRKVYTSRFGEIEVDEKKVVHFKDGIPAFEDEHEFVILPYEEDSPYYFMQSLKSPDLAFLLTIPFLFFNDYTFELDDTVVADLGIEDSENVFYYTMVTIPNGSIRYMTANLLAPIVLNGANMQAKQVVLEKTNYTTKHRLFPESAKKEG
ncbi:MAG: flagellar assembly protein FliW [Selenomonadaceae bacterium]|nr:flagellar assembly protein FliW [Selenomonadaceae bacterium]MBQ3726765.1 flagellar assembly protein FliW [Selenomonadaceae bacterium]MBQ9497965.1 flagellar assembly protein FliW [Selenomonadaceae bacterium]MBR3499510.1 flagellar assembly protein FliW [Selenomonadaceae bacterium]